jgi:hypothetical protein
LVDFLGLTNRNSAKHGWLIFGLKENQESIKHCDFTFWSHPKQPASLLIFGFEEKSRESTKHGFEHKTDRESIKHWLLWFGPKTKQESIKHYQKQTH